MLDLNKEIMTKDGRVVEQLTKLVTTPGSPCLVGTIDGEMMAWYEDGRYYVDGKDSGMDCINALVEYCAYINLYSNGGVGCAFDTPDEAAEEAAGEIASSIEPLDFVTQELVWYGE